MKIFLNKSEIFEIKKHIEGSGGFQSLMRGVYESLDLSTGEVDLSSSQIERIKRYSEEYGDGGFEDRIRRAFGRTLGV